MFEDGSLVIEQELQSKAECCYLPCYGRHHCLGESLWSRYSKCVMSALVVEVVVVVEEMVLVLEVVIAEKAVSMCQNQVLQI